MSYQSLRQWKSTVFYMNFILLCVQEAAQALLTAAFSGSQLPNITERARQYIMRGEELKKTGESSIYSFNTVTQSCIGYLIWTDGPEQTV